MVQVPPIGAEEHRFTALPRFGLPPGKMPCFAYWISKHLAVSKDQKRRCVPKGLLPCVSWSLPLKKKQTAGAAIG
jgi:hypothetical protein